ncbi:MAG: tripartite tricarboxylate transporter substrate binding protein [Betaproteobacteria bacterium]|nr:tripartite tricarboxylate transporter substrate binding protein [Betaproteobacteria bacterium]
MPTSPLSRTAHTLVVTRTSRGIGRAIALAALCLGMHSTAFAADAYPGKSIRFVVPYPPGGPTDLMARTVSGGLTQALGQTVVVDNRPGAGGNVGADIVAKSPGDGYTLLMGAISTHAINVSLYRKLPFDPVRDFVPITQVSWIPLVLCAHPSLQANTIAELIQSAKKSPGQIAYGSSGNGGGTHLAGELFKTMTGTDLVHVPYKGLSPATTDLIGGSIATMFNDLTTALQPYRAGRLKILGVSTEKRVAQIPEVPTIGETVKGYAAYTWFGMLAPANTPAAITERLNRETVKILRSEEIRKRFSELGAEPVGSTQIEFAAFIHSETEKWAKVIVESGSKVD